MYDRESIRIHCTAVAVSVKDQAASDKYPQAGVGAGTRQHERLRVQERSKSTHLRSDMQVAHEWAILFINDALGAGTRQHERQRVQERSRPTRLRSDMQVAHGWAILLIVGGHDWDRTSDPYDVNVVLSR